MKLVIWQQIVSPHMSGLAEAYASLGHEVYYVFENETSDIRRRDGWTIPKLEGVKLIRVRPGDIRELAKIYAVGHVHLVEGLRGNGIVGAATSELIQHGAAVIPVLEKVDDRGLRGHVKRLSYRMLARKFGPSSQALLCIGGATRRWLIDRDFPADKLYEFAYFLPEHTSTTTHPSSSEAFRIGYVGRLVSLKGVDLLISAMRSLARSDPLGPTSLSILGSGPEKKKLVDMSQDLHPEIAVEFTDAVEMERARNLIGELDLLVLPSRYDGWGAVVSEALLAGTRVIASDNCGARIAAANDTGSYVFKAGSVQSLAEAIKFNLKSGKVSKAERKRRREASSYLTAAAGAVRLENIIRGRASVKLIESSPE